MGYALTPQFYRATEVAFHSINPLFPGEILLDMYYVTIQDKDHEGKVIGEREVPCVTHESLMRYYREHLMLRRTTVNYEPIFSDPMVVKCTITKKYTPTDLKNLCASCPGTTNDDFGTEVSVVAIGEASARNAKSEIAQKHLANTAENRAFDRAIIKLLSLETDEAIYGSSEEIGEQDENAKPVPQQKDWLDKAKETIEKKPGKAEYEQIEMQIRESVKEPAGASAPMPAPAADKPASQPKKYISSESRKPIGRFDFSNHIHTIINAINGLERTTCSEELTMAPDNDKANVFNGKNIRQLVASVKEGDKDAIEKMYEIITDPPKLKPDSAYYVFLVQHLIDAGCLRFENNKLVLSRRKENG